LKRLRAVSVLLALAAGLAQAASMALPGSGQPAWWLQLLSLAVLAGLLERCGSARRGALLGWLFGTAWLCGTFWWLFISMHTYGGLPALLAGAAVLALAAFLALDYALAAAAAVAWRPAGMTGRVLVFAAAWLLAELARGSFYTGFPWGAGGYAHTDGPLAGLASRVGVYGIGFVAALLAGAGGLALARLLAKGWRTGRQAATAVQPAGRAPRLGRGDALAAVLVALLLGLAWALPVRGLPTGTLSIALLQGNIPQEEKFQGRTGVPQALAWYKAQMLAAPQQLVVAPETAIPLLPQQLPEGWFDDLAAHFQAPGRALLVGIPLGGFREGYTNSVIGITRGDTAYRFDKHHLVPFGEFIPPFFRWFTQMMDIPLGDFNRGALPQPPFVFQGERLAPNICYEDLFGEEIGRAFRDPATAPTVLVNVSNIAWFGDSLAIDQHLQISRMRALEFDRPMLRATNTGATAIIGHDGRVQRLLPRLTRGVLDGQVQGRNGLTPYAAWVSRLGLAPLWLLGAAVLGAAAWRRRART